ncbi:MAG: hypothetical protein ACTH0S_02950 [Senegalia sp. (in: firmicutes)]
MQLNKREKILIASAGALLFLFLIYNFILNPQLNKLSKLKEDELELLNELSNYKTSINTVKTIEKTIEDKKKNISFLTGNLFPELEQSEIILLLDEFIERSNLSLEAINFSEKAMRPIKLEEIIVEEAKDSRFKNIVNQYNNLVSSNKDLVEEIEVKEENKNIDDETEQAIELENISATIVYSGNYYEITNFLSLLDNYDKDIIIRGITMVENEDGVTGNILLDFYGIPKIDELNSETDTRDTDNNGKDNPFNSQ